MKVGLFCLGCLCSMHLHLYFNFILMLIYKNVLSPQTTLNELEALSF